MHLRQSAAHETAAPSVIISEVCVRKTFYISSRKQKTTKVLPYGAKTTSGLQTRGLLWQNETLCSMQRVGAARSDAILSGSGKGHQQTAPYSWGYVTPSWGRGQPMLEPLGTACLHCDLQEKAPSTSESRVFLSSCNHHLLSQPRVCCRLTNNITLSAPKAAETHCVSVTLQSALCYFISFSRQASEVAAPRVIDEKLRFRGY